MKIAWTAAAGHDMKALRRFIAEHDPQAAEATALQILDAVERLAVYPASGRAGRKPDTRELVMPRSAYVVVYRIVANRVEILRVLHGARQWPEA